MSRLLPLGLSIALASACGPSVTTVSVDPAKLNLVAKDQKTTLKAEPKDGNGKVVMDAVLRLKWASSNPAVATVANNGVVTAVKSGDAKITAAVGDVVGTTDVVVAIPASISFSPEKHEIVGVKKSVAVTPVVKDESGRDVTGANLVWSTSDGSIATVVDGTVTAEGAGTAVIKASSGEASGTVTVVVAHPPVGGIALEPASHTLDKVGDGVRLKAKITDAQGEAIVGMNPAWTSSDPKVATVTDGGQVQAVKKGKAKIKATADGKTAEAEIVVK